MTRNPTAQGANSVALGINNQGDVVGSSFQAEKYQDLPIDPVAQWRERDAAVREVPSGLAPNVADRLV